MNTSHSYHSFRLEMNPLFLILIKYFKVIKNLFSLILIALVCTVPVTHLISCNRIEGSEVQNMDSFPLIFRSNNSPSNSDKNTHADDKKDSVLICNSKSAYAYHKTYCTGLNRCKAGVSKISKKEASERGYRPCKFCY